MNPHRDLVIAIWVRLMTNGGGVLEQKFKVPSQTRVSVDVGSLFGLRGDVAFGVEVECDGCAASLVMWDAAYTVPAVSAPIVGCRY